MFDVGKLTLEEIDAEYGKTLDKLERLSKLREAAADQNLQRIKRLVADYNAAVAASSEPSLEKLRLLARAFAKVPQAQQATIMQAIKVEDANKKGE